MGSLQECAGAGSLFELKPAQSQLTWWLRGPAIEVLKVLKDQNIASGRLGSQIWDDQTGVACRWRRYVCEDRFTAIRWAISTAQERDMVIIAGKGSEDFQEVASQLPDGNWAMLRVTLLDSHTAPIASPFCLP